MPNLIDETQIIAAENALLLERDNIDAQLKSLAQDRRAISRRFEAETEKRLNVSYQQALTAVGETKDKIAFHELSLADLIDRQKAGDRSVSASDLRDEKDAIETLQNYLISDESLLKKAEEALRPFAADSHLAEFAADVLEDVLGHPVLIRTDVADAPQIVPSVILSQRKPTSGYGTLSPSGSVLVQVVGDPRIDWRAVRHAFEDTGSEVSISAERIKFERASFPLPVLEAPSRSAVRAWAETFADAWRLDVSQTRHAARMRSAGYQFNGATGFEGFAHVKAAELTCNRGVAIGRASLSLATTENLAIGDLCSKVEELVSMFASANVGTHTEAGEVVDISLLETAPGDRGQWSGVFYRFPPQTLDATVQITYRYAEPARQIAGD